MWNNTCAHDSLHSRLLNAALHVTQVLNVAICKHWNIYRLPAAQTHHTWLGSYDRSTRYLQDLKGGDLAYRTALMCSQLAIPVMAPFWSLVLPCTVSSWEDIWQTFKQHLKLPETDSRLYRFVKTVDEFVLHEHGPTWQPALSSIWA